MTAVGMIPRAVSALLGMNRTGSGSLEETRAITTEKIYPNSISGFEIEVGIGRRRQTCVWQADPQVTPTSGEFNRKRLTCPIHIGNWH